MTYTPHWSASQHAERILRENAKTTAKPDLLPFRRTALETVVGQPEPRRVALALAWLTRDIPLESRREILQMVGAIQ